MCFFSRAAGPLFNPVHSIPQPAARDKSLFPPRTAEGLKKRGIESNTGDGCLSKFWDKKLHVSEAEHLNQHALFKHG